MFGFMRRWRPSTLLASWVAYWAALVLFGLWPAWGAIWKATHAGTGKGDASFSFGSDMFSLVVHLNGKTIYTGSLSLLSLALLIAVPPLVLWALWLAQRSRVADSYRVDERA